jgi:hypothetical protein
MEAEQLAQSKKSLQATVRQGKAWVDKLEPELRALPKGTVVVINCATGEYVTAESRLAGMDRFEERFGDVAGYLHEIGGGLFIGGGIA